MDSVLPLERSSKYGDPLDEALKKANLGEVTGGGSLLSKEKVIEWIGLDIELVNLNGALEFAKLQLRELRVPPGSTLEYKCDGKAFNVPIYDQ